MKNYKYNIVLSILFCASIFTPLIIGVIEKDKKVSRYEKRNLYSLPSAPENAKDLEGFPQELDQYYSDHFGLRNWFTGMYRKVKFSLGDSPSEDVTVGQDGWLFLGSIKAGYKKNSDPIGDYRNINRYSKKQLKSLVKYFKGLDFWLSQQGIKFVFLIAPNKHSVYDDKLPEYITKINETSAQEQLIYHLKKYTKINVVELLEPLIDKKNDHQLYHKIDTHWTHHGANIAQFEIFKTLQKLFPSEIDPNLFEVKEAYSKGGDLAGYIGIYGLSKYDPLPVFPDSCTPSRTPQDALLREVFTDECDDNKVTALIYRDSFYTKLTPYFSRQLNKTTYVFKKINYQLLKKQISQFKPQLVIEEWVERHLPYVPKDAYIFKKHYDREVFNQSEEILFSNDWKQLKMNKSLKLVSSSKSHIKLKPIGNDPTITIKNLNFKNHDEYIINIKLNSSIKSSFRIFYSRVGENSPKFTQQHSIKKNINKGFSDAYISLDYQNLGSELRIDLNNTSGIEIKEIVIKKVVKLFNKN
ncbi:MAG: hypothetical protein AB8B80_12740 [Marinicellaceae bacterium]